MNSILVVAHAPLASALRQGVLHVFPEAQSSIAAIDVEAGVPIEQTLALARAALAQLTAAAHGPDVLVAADVVGATPCNLACRLADEQHVKLVAGANLPMLLRAMTYRHEPIDAMLERAIEGANQGVMRVAAATAEKPKAPAP
jgi:PTS system mannose-specific IIA component